MMFIRDEQSADIDPIRVLVTDAFASVPYSSETEAAIVDALRDAGVLVISLVAIDGNDVVGHIAFSPVQIDGEDIGWYGLGPIAVDPSRQGLGIGSALTREGLHRLKAIGAEGCVLLGEPEFYGRFGFKSDSALVLEGVPPEYFQCLTFKGQVPSGTVTYHEAFASAA